MREGVARREVDTCELGVGGWMDEWMGSITSMFFTARLL